MNEPRPTLQKQSRTELLDGLTGSRRRVLAAVAERESPVSERDLAAALAGITEEESSEEIHVALRHVHLPKLDEVDLVDWDRAERTVSAPDDLTPDDVREDRAPAGRRAEWDEAGRDVLNERRRTVLTLLETHPGPQDVTSLARDVAAWGATGEPSPEAVDAAALRLHHVDLPKLDRAGLIEYDVDDGTVY